MTDTSIVARRQAIPLVLVLVTAALLLADVGLHRAHAATTTVKGSACGYFVNVGLFGGPRTVRGCGQPADAPPTAASPSVTLSPDGTNSPQTAEDTDGALAQYGPASIFGGIWPDNVTSSPPSGPMRVSSQGTPETGSVTSTADIVLRDPPNPDSPGGFRGAGVHGNGWHATCTASGAEVTGSVAFDGASLTTSTDASGDPKTTEAIPDNPPVNYTRSGVVTNVGDVFTVVFNQQVHNDDGSLTVNAVHSYLFGPTAVGEEVQGQVNCGTEPHPAVPTDTTGPSCGPLDVEPVSPTDPTPRDPRTELIGVFDAGGLQSIDNIVSDNATVAVGDANGFPYLNFTPGQTEPLAITATRIDRSKPMTWSFDATDAAGNVTHSSKCPTDSPEGGPSTSTSSTSSTSTTFPTSPGATTTTSTTRPTSPGATTTTLTTRPTSPGATTTTSTTRPSSTTTTTRSILTTTTSPPGINCEGVAPTTGTTAKVDPDSVQAGADTGVTGEGFTPGEPLGVTLCSSPVTVGHFVANGSGAFVATVTVPSGTAPGTHTVVVTNADASRIATAPLTVFASDRGQSVTTGAAGTAGDSGGTGTDGVGALARTGEEVARLGWEAGVMLIMGLVLVRHARRVRRSPVRRR